MTSRENSIASVLQILGGLAIVVGVIGGLSYGMSANVLIGLTFLAKTVIWGIVFFGFSEVIKLLQGIFNQREEMIVKSADEGEGLTDTNELTTHSPVGIQARQDIEAFYAEKGMQVQEIRATEKDDIYLVTVDGKQEVVELGGFSPVILPMENFKK
ncbi:hypothetical protein VBD025_15390 [Virgibacillus flavescens]|uniref:hypothetical protein n=1 Tax=Virgibacillus flavescens TaxID=1611422 RepID=UPI003D341E0C